MLTRRVFALLRTLVVAPAFISLWMYYLPRWIVGARAFEHPRPLGWIVVGIGAAIALPCIWAFAWRGIGTPAPFDPPRRLVISGPYRFVRNPMYLGMSIALIGEGIVFPQLSWTMLAMVAVLIAFATTFVIAYEEPTLQRTFGADYENYRRSVRRWLPRLRPFDNLPTVP